jgi:hypothetical protein
MFARSSKAKSLQENDLACDVAKILRRPWIVAKSEEAFKSRQDAAQSASPREYLPPAPPAEPL